VQTVAEVANKKINIRHIEGPVGVKARNFRIDKISSIGWASKFSLKEGIAHTFPWVKNQVDLHKKTHP